MTAATNNPFQNYSGPSGLNRGGNGKFTPSQTQERLKVHAKSLVVGVPTIAQIVEIWKERFNINITIPSEKEWRGSNREAIEKTKLELIESGEITVPVVSEEVLSDSLMNTAISTSRLAKDIQKTARIVMRKINLDGDDDIELVKVRINAFKVFTDAAHKLNSSFTEQTTQLFAMSGKIKIKDHKIRELVDKQFDERMQKADNEDEDIADPMEFEVTDAMREKLNAD